VAVVRGGAGRGAHERRRGRWHRLFHDWQFWLGLAISLFLVQALAQANYVYVLPALLAYFAGVAVRAMRWSVLLRPIKPLGWRQLFPVVVIGYMANDVLPARMGELVRTYVLSRDHGLAKTTGLATIFVERVFDGVTMLLFLATVALFVPLGAGIESIARLAGVILVALLVAAVAVAASPAQAARFAHLFVRLAPASARPRLIALVDRFSFGLSALQSGRTVLGVLGLSVLAWLLEATMYYVLGFGFALALGFHAFLLTTAVANLGTMVPSSPGYIGTFEALAVFTLGRFAVAGDLALSYAVALHAALLVPITLWGFYYMWRRHVTLTFSEGNS
jgi:uncharacterized protein (TIRG00374 family)